MSKILFFIREYNSTCMCCTKDYSSYTEIVRDIDTFTRYHLGLSIDTNNNFETVSLIEIATDYPGILALTSWEALEEALDLSYALSKTTTIATPAVMYTKVNRDIYGVAFPYKRVENEVNIVHCDNELGYELSYSSINSPEVSNIKNHIWELKDIKITKTDRSNTLDFTKSIPIINGMVLYPWVYMDSSQVALFALNGTLSLANLQSNSIGTFLIDFTEIGSVKTIRFSNCVRRDHTTGLSVQLPLKYDDGSNIETLNNKSILLVVANRFFYPYEFKLSTTEETPILTIDLNDANLGPILLMNDQIRNDYITGTTTSYITNVSEYIDDMMSLSHYDSFIVIIDNETLSVVETPELMHIDTTTIKFPIDSNGLLIRNTTREIVDYTKLNIETDDSVTMLFTTTDDIATRDKLDTSLMTTKESCYVWVLDATSPKENVSTYDDLLQIPENTRGGFYITSDTEKMFYWNPRLTEYEEIDPTSIVYEDTKVLFYWDNASNDWIKVTGCPKYTVVTITDPYMLNIIQRWQSSNTDQLRYQPLVGYDYTFNKTFDAALSIQDSKYKLVKFVSTK